MRYLNLPGQIKLNLSTSNLLGFVQLLQNTLEYSGRVRALLLISNHVETSKQVQQIWATAAQSLQPHSRHQLVVCSCIYPHLNPSESPPQPTHFPGVKNHSKATFNPTQEPKSSLNLWENNSGDPLGAGCAQSTALAILSTSLNVWIDLALEPIDTDPQQTLALRNEPAEIEQQNLDFSVSTSSLSQTSPKELWQISLIFNPNIIAQQLKNLYTKFDCPQNLEFNATDLEQDSNFLRRFWLQLLHCMENDFKFNQDTVKEKAYSLGQPANALEPNPSPSDRMISPHPYPSGQSDQGSEKMTASGVKSRKNYKAPKKSKNPAKKSENTFKIVEITPEHPLIAEAEKQLFLEAPIGIVYKSLEGGIIHANPAFCHLIGYTEMQLRHLDLRSISHPADFAAEVRLIQRMIDEGTRQQILRKRYIRSNGAMVWAETQLKLVGDGSDESSYLLAFVTDLSEHTKTEQEIEQRREREALLSEISATIRTTFDLPTILQLGVNRLRHALNADRVVAYQIRPDGSGVCVAEDVHVAYPPMKGETFPSDCIPPPYLAAYRNGRLWSVTDVQRENLAQCHIDMLEQVHVRSMMAVAIQRTEGAGERAIASGMETPPFQTQSGQFNVSPFHLWGLLVVHQCRAPREWTRDEEQLLQAVANQMAIAIEQAHLVHQLQAYTHELEERVKQRTRSLERSLQFEQLIRQLTETLRKVINEEDAFKAAVEGLVRTLGIDGCSASLFQEEEQVFQVRYEHASVVSDRTWAGSDFCWSDFPDTCQQQLLAGEICLHAIAWDPNTHPRPKLGHLIRSEQLIYKPIQTLTTPQGFVLISPILDNEGLIGALCLFHSQPRRFDADEIKLIKQVANQCAIAIRQAHLHRQEHSARMSAEYFRSFLEQSTYIFVEYDPALRFRSINPAGAALFGLPASEIIGKTNQAFLGAEAISIEPLLNNVFHTNQKVIVTQEIAFPVGVKTFETVYSPITDTTGKIHRVIAISQDVTEIRKQWQILQEQNHQLAEINRLKEEFIATTSHELRTPLTAILGFSSVLLEETFGQLNSKQKDYANRIHTSGQHLLALINDILDLSRIEADRLELEPQLIFIQDICESVTSLIQERVTNHGLYLDVDITPDVEYMVADPRRLKQMLLNLLSNAIKFTPSGTVGLKIYKTSNPISPCGTGAPQPLETIHFMVWDTGIGIAHMDQPRLFSPFSQIDSSLSRKYQGTGLGLAITRKLAQLHGGTVSLESRRGEGSRFIISLPLHLSPETLPGLTDPLDSYSAYTFSQLTQQLSFRNHNQDGKK